MSFLSRLLHPSDTISISPADFALEDRDGAPVIDVRTPKEFAQGHLSGALNIDVHDHEFKDQIEALVDDGVLKKEGPVYLYCRSGARSGTAARTLVDMGFTKAKNVGGYQALKEEGLAVEEPG